MIVYTPFWETLNKKNVSTYDLIYKQAVNANTIHRMRHGKAITTKTINELCMILGCEVSDIIRYEQDL